MEDNSDHSGQEDNTNLSITANLIDFFIGTKYDYTYLPDGDGNQIVVLTLSNHYVLDPVALNIQNSIGYVQIPLKLDKPGFYFTTYNQGKLNLYQNNPQYANVQLSTQENKYKFQEFDTQVFTENKDLSFRQIDISTLFQSNYKAILKSNTPNANLYQGSSQYNFNSIPGIGGGPNSIPTLPRKAKK